MTTTLQQIRDIIQTNKEVLGLDTTLQMILHGGYKLSTENQDTIARTFREVQDELRLVSETERRVKDEFHAVAVAIAITFLVIGMAIGYFLI